MNYPTELEFLKHTLDVLIIGDSEMIADHAKTVQLRITTLTNEIEYAKTLEKQQAAIDNKIKGLFPERVGKAFHGGRE